MFGHCKHRKIRRRKPRTYMKDSSLSVADHGRFDKASPATSVRTSRGLGEQQVPRIKGTFETLKKGKWSSA